MQQLSYIQKYAVILIVLFGIYYLPIEGFGGFGPLKMALMFSTVPVLLFWCFSLTKPMLIGFIYITWQVFVGLSHPESLRWSTLFYSMGFVIMYCCVYNLIYARHVFTVHLFLKVVKWMIYAYFIVCVIQQTFILIGIRIFPLINLTYELNNRGIGCYSLSMEPSTFARTMLVLYYAYVKCKEYIRGEGPFSVMELFSSEHRTISLMFLWMMTTMGSGTAYVCLIVFSLYFVRWHNWYYIIPILGFIFYMVLPIMENEQLERATATIEATTTLDRDKIMEADGSGALRINPTINSLKADFTKKETWFGHGIDYALKNRLVLKQRATLFDDYGVIFYIIALIFNFTCAYRFFSLATIFMFTGIGGGAGSNIHYAWELMFFITAVRYFYENQDNPELFYGVEYLEEQEENEDEQTA